MLVGQHPLHFHQQLEVPHLAKGTYRFLSDLVVRDGYSGFVWVFLMEGLQKCEWMEYRPLLKKEPWCPSITNWNTSAFRKDYAMVFWLSTCTLFLKLTIGPPTFYQTLRSARDWVKAYLPDGLISQHVDLGWVHYSPVTNFQLWRYYSQNTYDT